MNKQTKILAVLPGMWARGGEICTLNLLTGLREQGYENLYFHAALRHNLPVDMELHLLPRLQKVCEVTWGIHGDTPGLSGILASRITDIQPDILLYAWDGSIPKYAPKSVLVIHGIAPNDFDGYNPEHTDAVVCVSRFAARMATEVPESRLHVIPNGVPIAEGKNRRKEWNIPADAWVWCFVGGLNKLKRPNLLISALSRRVHAWKDEYAVFAGVADGGMRLDEYATALGVRERCKFLGHVDTTGDVYRSSNCLVITSERESMPLTMLEAMSVGVPTVANNVGGISEVLNPHIGITTDVTNEEEFDRALTNIRLTSIDEIRSCVTTNLWRERYSHTIMTSAYLRLFEHLLAQEG